MKRTHTPIGFGMLLLVSAPAAAEQAPSDTPAPVEPSADVEVDDSAIDEGLDSIQLHGFASQGFMKSTANNYLTFSKYGSFEFTDAALNVTLQATSSLRGGLQLYSYNLGPDGNFAVQLDWAFLEYTEAEWLQIRAGRFKLAAGGLYNDIVDVDAARVPILLPSGIYNPDMRDTDLQLSGLAIGGTLPLGSVGGLSYELFGGADPMPVAADVSPRIKYKAGGTLMWEAPAPVDGLRIGGSIKRQSVVVSNKLAPMALQGMKAAGKVPPDFDGKFQIRLPNHTTYLASVEFERGDLLLAAEYGRRSTKQKFSLPIKPDGWVRREQMYALVAYRFAPWFATSAYYSLYFADPADRDGKAADSQFQEEHQAYQHDAALTLRFDINSYWLAKLEGHYFNGTARLFQSAASGLPNDPSTAEGKWGLFLARTTFVF